MPVTRLLRARVNDRLTRAARFPVTLIVAPAGFGKSVALRDFIATSRLEAVRYDVAREQRTLMAFVHGLSAALEPVAPSALAAFPAMQQRIMGATDPVRELASWFAEHLKRTVCTIVIDDLHFAAADPDVVALLVDLIERGGERIRWIIATRSDVGLPAASWIGYGRMDYPIGEDDLRFTVEEALATADDAQTSADPGEVEALRELTGGWPIALSIALRTRMHAADLRAAASGTREMVYRYLAEQVFAGLKRGQQLFLLRTCVFSTFDVEIAEEFGASTEFLAELRRTVTFLSTASTTEYRYHDLFRDFLEHELRRSGAGEWFGAHVEAAELLERRRGNEATALALYAKVGAVDAVVRIVETCGIELLERGEGELVATALDAVPEAARRRHAATIGVRAMLDANRGRFDVAEAGFVAAIEGARDVELRVGLVHRYAIELVRQGRDCVELLEPYARDQTLAPELRVPILGTLATGYMRAQRVDDALATMRRALDSLEELDDGLRARVYQQAAFVYQFSPASERARTYATFAVELATARGLFDVAARAYSVLYAVVSGDDDDPIAALAVLDKLQECARKGASRQVRIFGIVESYAIEVDRNDEAAIERLERELLDDEALARTHGALLPAHALRAAWEGDFQRAYELLAGTAERQEVDERRALRAAETALYAFSAGLSAQGDESLHYAVAALERCKPTPRALRAQLTVALTEVVRGRASTGHRQLADAERKLTPQMRRLRVFANAVRAMERVQLEQADPATLAAALERLRAEHFGGLARMLAALPIARLEEPGYAQLTPSEREILQLLAKGASTKDVAAKSGRSPQTVDTHIRSICRKLNCSGRREAIAIATGAGWVNV
jgi:LuxR family transcriptional regulator, maltose regulon positive regulatory protein